MVLPEPVDALVENALPSRQNSQQWLECLRCQAQHEVKPMFLGCPNCAKQGVVSALEMHYKPRLITSSAVQIESMWNWAAYLPDVSCEVRVTLGEGATNLLPLHDFGPGPSMFLKNETTNPTWSWKDRPNSVSVSMAKYFGFHHVVAISTGNHGNAMAAMATAAGLEATVFCNAEAPALQMAMMKNYGASVVRGGDAEAMVLNLIRKGTHFPCTVLSPQAGYTNPFGIEGFKTIAFEIWQQLGRIPDRLFVGVGSGDGVYGIWKGFRELRDSGTVDRVPRIFGCQTQGANSLVRAFVRGDRNITPLTSAKTVASSLAELAVGDQALSAVYDSGGAALEVSDEAALKAMRWITRRGIALEPSSAVPLACAQQMRSVEKESEIAGEVWVSIGSGAAPKWPDDVLTNFVMPKLLPIAESILE